MNLTNVNINSPYSGADPVIKNMGHGSLTMQSEVIKFPDYGALSSVKFPI